MPKNSSLIQKTYRIQAKNLEEATIQAMAKFLEEHPHVDPESVHIANAKSGQKAN